MLLLQWVSLIPQGGNRSLYTWDTTEFAVGVPQTQMLVLSTPEILQSGDQGIHTWP
jgi:hypothetical protein